MKFASVTEGVAVIKGEAVGLISQGEARRELKASPWKSRTECERGLEAPTGEAQDDGMIAALKGASPSDFEKKGP